MTHNRHYFLLAGAASLTLALVITGALAEGQPGPQALPNMGQQITPLAPQGSRFQPLDPELPYDAKFLAAQGWQAGQAVSSTVSPDHQTLLILTSGYNRVSNLNIQPPPTQPSWYVPDSTEYVFIYDISTPVPIKKQVLQIANTYNGIVFDPSGAAFYVSGGPSDNIHVVTQAADRSWEDRPDMVLALGHTAGLGLNVPPQAEQVPINLQVAVHPAAAGVAISSDGQTMVVANYYNDSVTVFNGGLGTWSKLAELDLRPGKIDPSKTGSPGGEYPFWVAIKGSGSDATAYVSSLRDREIVVVSASQPSPSVTARIPVKGQPNKMTLNAAATLLYVVEDESDTVDVIDTRKNAIVETIPVIGPTALIPSSLARYTGANSNSVALSPDETQLYVTNGNLNAVAVVALTGTSSGDQVVGLIPTGWYPNSVSFNGDGSMVYVVNGKSPTGPNPGWCYGGYGPVGGQTCGEANQYTPQLTKAGFQTFPRPNAAQLTALTTQVATNDRLTSTESEADAAIMAAVRQGTQHVIFIIKENRTYDQILGDAVTGNGDPDLTEFGQAITPNEHKLAQTFVTLDNFLDTAEVSYDGWLWTTAARAPDIVQKQYPVAYAYRGLSLDSEGTNRNVNVAIPTLAGRKAADPFTADDPDVLPGQANVGAPDGPNDEQNTGYLWDNALRANLTVRNYGFFVDMTRYGTADYHIPLDRNPFASGTIVAYPASVSLSPHTDPYFRGFDNAFPDYYRYTEWAREFDTNYANGGLPSLSLVRFMHDHTGNYGTAIDGVSTPDQQVADNDYAVGLLIQKISNSAYANNTLIFIVEDDAQDGGDHMDSHRTTAFVAGAYVKQGVVVSTQYNTIDYVRTIEEVLGLTPMNLNDALGRPMTDIFNTTPTPWSFSATPAAILYNTQLPLPPRAEGLIGVTGTTDNAQYWARATRGMDFQGEDRVDPSDFNHILWAGLMGDKPYPVAAPDMDVRQILWTGLIGNTLAPVATTGRDLSNHRDALLARYHRANHGNDRWIR